MGRAAYTLIATLGVSLLACGPVEETPDASPEVGDSRPAPCELPAQARADGTCCPDGQIYAQTTGTCTGVGPPECAATIFSAPEDCHPRWCWDWLSGDGEPCAPEEEGCRV